MLATHTDASSQRLRNIEFPEIILIKCEQILKLLFPAEDEVVTWSCCLKPGCLEWAVDSYDIVKFSRAAFSHLFDLIL